MLRLCNKSDSASKRWFQFDWYRSFISISSWVKIYAMNILKMKCISKQFTSKVTKPQLIPCIIALDLCRRTVSPQHGPWVVSLKKGHIIQLLLNSDLIALRICHFIIFTINSTFAIILLWNINNNHELILMNNLFEVEREFFILRRLKKTFSAYVKFRS